MLLLRGLEQLGSYQQAQSKQDLTGTAWIHAYYITSRYGAIITIIVNIMTIIYYLFQ